MLDRKRPVYVHVLEAAASGVRSRRPLSYAREAGVLSLVYSSIISGIDTYMDSEKGEYSRPPP